ncbi:RGG repeats nuclear RNA binding protein C-like isoform X5 [Arachis ipaensis]|uniref:RGG repeats nuclear RNA binding protein C-like isoform X5 n=1 Tax=Arachis ipaensis TaxID=130454 RepID=UPI000A2B631F|nr:RGG repeats nuclear RNA binding protein C-like isoform X5 [Arachis ipaensis]XP_020968168.1 RGG repeats nuclear RNA binding protein C-like isoform X5 [Arachis ipaensis]
MATSNPFHLRGDDAEVSSRQIAAAAATSPLKKGSAAAAQQQQQTQLASKPVPPAQAGGEDLRLDIRDGKEKARGYSEEGATTG